MARLNAIVESKRGKRFEERDKRCGGVRLELRGFMGNEMESWKGVDRKGIPALGKK